MLNIDKCETGEPVPMLNDNHSDLFVHERLQQFRAVIIHPRCNLLHHCGDLIAPASGIRFEAFHLSLQVSFLSLCGDPCIEGNAESLLEDLNWLTHDHRARMELVGVEFARLPPTESRLIMDSHLFCILA